MSTSGKRNRYLEAFQENYNVVGLAGAAALSAALLNPLPLLAGLVAEAAYLLFVPDSKWYDARLSAKHDAEIEARRRRLKEQTLPQLRDEMRGRFARLEATRDQIVAQAKNDERYFREVLRKLDYLLEKFLLFAAREAQFRDYLRSVHAEVCGSKRRGGASGGTDRPEYERYWQVNDRRAASAGKRGRRDLPFDLEPDRTPEIPAHRLNEWVTQTVGDVQGRYTNDKAELQTFLEREQDANTQAVLQKRIDVLDQRHEFIGRIAKILTNVNQQLELLEDTFGLINDQIRARSPEQVLADIESVVWQTDSMTQLLNELAPYEEMSARLDATG